MAASYPPSAAGQIPRGNQPLAEARDLQLVGSTFDGGPVILDHLGNPTNLKIAKEKKRTICGLSHAMFAIIILIFLAAAGGAGAAAYILSPVGSKGDGDITNSTTIAPHLGPGTAVTNGPTVVVASSSPTVPTTSTNSPSLLTVAPSVATKSPTIATSAPVTTKSPTVATSAPISTSSPSDATAAPIVTKSPTLATAAPIVTKSPTLATAAPIVTKSPTVATSAPIVTKSPTVATAAPVVTTSPTVATAAPIVTKSPTVATAAPIATKSPTMATAAPIVTKSPTLATAAPIVTKSPTIATAAPVLTKSPTSGPATNFNIQLVFLTSMTVAETQAFNDAKARWEQVITADFASNITVPQGQVLCGQPAAPASFTIDDILIYAEVKPIDGVNNILGQAGPCGIAANQVRLGKMTFDSADTATMATSGTLKSVILHEMGHVLGIGTRWDANDLISDASVTSNIQYFGAQGNIGQAEIGGSGNAIIEDTGGPGTARGHWKESVYQNELMTGYISGATQPMSRLTIRALADLGYTVNPNLADSFSLPTDGRRLRGAVSGVRLHNDLYTGPVIELPLSQRKAKPGRENDFAKETEEYHKKRNL